MYVCIQVTHVSLCTYVQIPKVQYSPHHCEGFGLSDGEGMERLWSYLRRFSRMTKEMRPSHRIDVLSDAIIYYRQKAVNNIGNHDEVHNT